MSVRRDLWKQPTHEREIAEHPGSGLRDHVLGKQDGLGLLVQGGGMRGAFAMGALSELHRNGLTEAFDIGLGNSAGAISLAYFLAGQVDQGSDQYWSVLHESKIFNPYRFWRIVDVDRMIDEAMFQTLPLDVSRLRQNPTKMLIGVTDARYRLPAYFSADGLDTDQLRASLKATAALPGLFNRKIRVAGRAYIDGGFVDTLPLFRLKMLGCDRIVVVCTTPLAYNFVNDSWARRSLIKAFAYNQSRYVRQWIGSPNPIHDENLEALLHWAQDPERSRVLAIAPESRLPDFVRDARQLGETFEAGRKAAGAALSEVTWL